MHPLFWTNKDKMEVISKFSGMIPSPQNMESDIHNLLADFSNDLSAKVPGKRWCDELPRAPLRQGWGISPPQKPPENAFNPSQPEVSLFRFIRNIWAHRSENIKAGFWKDENEIASVFFNTFPWLMVTLYRLLQKYFPNLLSGWIPEIL